MSTIVVVKENNTLVLGTDSRFMKADFSGVASDAEQKTFEIAPGAFIATSGWKMTGDFQVERAREIAKALGTSDVRKIAEALERDTLAFLSPVVAQLDTVLSLHENYGRIKSGEADWHGCVLAGKTAGNRLGYVKQIYRVRDGQVVCNPDESACNPGEYFGAPRQIFITSGDPGIRAGMAQDPAIWTGRPVWVVKRILAKLKAATPTIGGPDQIVSFEHGGAQWLNRVTGSALALEGLATATISASITMTSPTLVITSGSTVINLDQTNQFKISGGVNANTVQITQAGGFVLTNPSGYNAYLDGNGLRVYSGTGGGQREALVGSLGLQFWDGSSMRYGQTTTVNYTKADGTDGTMTFYGGVLVGSF